MLPMLCVYLLHLLPVGSGLLANAYKSILNARHMYGKCCSVGNPLETLQGFLGHLSKKHGTFVQKKRDICPDIFGTFADRSGTALGQYWDASRTWPSKRQGFAPKTDGSGTFVRKKRDICPKNAGHLSGHSSLEIELENRDRDRDRDREKLACSHRKSSAIV